MRTFQVLLLACCLVVFSSLSFAQTTAPDASASPPPPIPDYPVAYRVPTIEQITDALTHVRHRLEIAMPPAPYDPSGVEKINFAQAPYSYPTGVIFNGMLAAADATGDKAFGDYVAKRFQFYSDAAASGQTTRLRRMLNPGALDDCGAMGEAMIKARRAGVGPDMQETINKFANYIEHKQYRLADGTLARHGPFPDSVWGDDMYMSVPFLAQMGALSGDTTYFDDAVKQVVQISQHLWVPSEGLMTHAWNGGNPDYAPRYYWGRANGWCVMAMVELLGELPADHPGRDTVIKLLREESQTLATLQSGSGLWHQMLDRPDSYLETSASAMFTFAIARGVNRGWLDVHAYGPVALAGWNGLASRIDENGNISGTCIGTSYAADYVYYYNRPMRDDVHGYGPVLLAGSEIIKMLKNENLRITKPDRGSGPIYVQQRAAGGN